MAAFAKRARLTSQPQYAAGLDWSNPLTRGVIEVYNAAAPQRIAGGYAAAIPSGTGYRASSATSGGVVLPAVPRDAAAGTVLFIALGSSAAEYYWDGETGSNRDLFYRGFTSPDVGGYGWYVNSTLIADNSNSAIASTFLDNGVCALRWTSSAQSAWKNGAQVQSWSRTIGASASTRAVRLGSRFNSTEGLTSGALVLRVEWSRALSDDEIAKVTADPWQLFAPRRVLLPVAGGGGGNTIAVPAGALTLSGFAPTVTATANQRINVPAGSLSLSAFAPVVTSTVRIVVPAGSLNLSALAPTVTATANNRIAPPAGTLTLTAYAPTVAAGATQTISVPAGALTLTGFAPTVTATQNRNVSVPNGALVLTGFAPNVSGVVQTIAVPSGTLVLAAFAPAVSNGAEEFTSSAVFYVPLRMVSGLWSTAGVSASIPADKQAWLPPIRQPIAYVDQRDGRTYCDPAWYRAFEFVFESRLGGRLGPSIPDVVSTVAATQETAAAASATIAEVAQQTQANAEALFVVREVVQGGALDGADQIPGVDLR